MRRPCYRMRTPFPSVFRFFFFLRAIHIPNTGPVEFRTRTKGKGSSENGARAYKLQNAQSAPFPLAPRCSTSESSATRSFQIIQADDEGAVLTGFREGSSPPYSRCFSPFFYFLSFSAPPTPVLTVRFSTATVFFSREATLLFHFRTES